MLCFFFVRSTISELRTWSPVLLLMNHPVESKPSHIVQMPNERLLLLKMLLVSRVSWEIYPLDTDVLCSRYAKLFLRPHLQFGRYFERASFIMKPGGNSITVIFRLWWVNCGVHENSIITFLMLIAARHYSNQCNSQSFSFSRLYISVFYFNRGFEHSETASLRRQMRICLENLNWGNPLMAFQNLLKCEANFSEDFHPFFDVSSWLISIWERRTLKDLRSKSILAP